MMTSNTPASAVELSARRRITWRLMPYLLLLFIISFLDRTNLAVAALGMKTELGFTDAVIGAGAGVFFLGYFLLEVPGSLIVERWSARKWIARIMLSWGLVASFMGLIGLPVFGFLHLNTQFYSLRFILGLAEAGFFPGVMVYLARWFRYEDRARAKAYFLIGIPLATVIGVPISQLIMHNVAWLGMAGWRWVFILEGIPAVVLGFVTLGYLTDRPEEATWLPEAEKQWIVEAIEQERRNKQAVGQPGLWAGLRDGVRHPRTLLLAAIYLCTVTGFYGLTFFLPSIVSRMRGTSVAVQTLITTLPYALGFAGILFNGSHSDKTGERRWHAVWPMLLASLAMGASVLAGDHLGLAIAALCLIGIGVHAYLPVYWTHPTSYLNGSAAATAVGVINSVGNLGGYFGPTIVGALSTRTGSFATGMWFLAGCLMVASLLASQLRPLAGRATRGRPGRS